MSRIIQKQIDAYRDNFIKYGTTPMGTFQNDASTQYERFNQLITPLLAYKSTEFTICDVGSGVSDLHKFLQEKKIRHSYTGIEIVQEMVDAAKSIYPGINVINQDLLADDYQQKFDFCVLSGTFNLPGSVALEDWQKFIFSVIRKMYALSSIAISFNALTSYTTFRSKDLFYLEPNLTLDYIQKNISRFCILNMDTPLYEVTYTIFKPDVKRKQFPNLKFDKYFQNIT